MGKQEQQPKSLGERQGTPRIGPFVDKKFYIGGQSTAETVKNAAKRLLQPRPKL